MKKNLFLTAALFAIAFGANSQNIIVGSSMDNAPDWANGPCNVPGISPEIAFVDETAYGGPNAANNIAEIDILTCIRQTVTVTPGTIYTINFDATKRVGCAPEEVNPGIRVIITGVPSGTVYSSVDYHYNNTTWVGYTGETQIWSIPGSATDASVRVDVVPIDNAFDCGVLVDNFEMQASGVLPVSLSSFNAAAKSAAIELNWVAATEINNAYYTIMRSKDGVSFAEIGRVNATGANGGSYSFTDPAPVAGYNYYRLKQTDKNGVFKLSGIIKVNLNAADYNAVVYPTIVTSVLNYAVESPKAVKLTVLVSDVTGKMISSSAQRFAAGTTQKTINVSALASGVYLLTVSDNEGGFKKTIRFTKN